MRRDRQAGRALDQLHEGGGGRRRRGRAGGGVLAALAAVEGGVYGMRIGGAVSGGRKASRFRGFGAGGGAVSGGPAAAGPPAAGPPSPGGAWNGICSCGSAGVCANGTTGIGPRSGALNGSVLCIEIESSTNGLAPSCGVVIWKGGGLASVGGVASGGGALTGGGWKGIGVGWIGIGGGAWTGVG
ncbi:MAG: hypothetical protein NTX64_13395 [Elusimicrobia bacterium]|nr:hypothetical protein [Elusimicrobiota bacterium]